MATLIQDVVAVASAKQIYDKLRDYPENFWEQFLIGGKMKFDQSIRVAVVTGDIALM